MRPGRIVLGISPQSAVARSLHNNFWGQRKRSIFLYDDKLYTVTRDNFLVALDAKTGKAVVGGQSRRRSLCHQHHRPDCHQRRGDGRRNCQEAPFGCYVTGNDAADRQGVVAQRVIPQGEPGDETWAKKPFEQRWVTGVWGPITYDPELNLAFYGSSGVGPASEHSAA